MSAQKWTVIEWDAQDNGLPQAPLYSKDDDVVTLSTIHAAKGLEWPVVHLAGMEDGLVPIGHAKTPEAKSEERRLVYVAITRAERELHCSWAEHRTFGGRVSDRSSSRERAREGARPSARARSRRSPTRPGPG